MKIQKKQAFTLVELIVVVTILAILATIWFVSYSSYLTWVRDTNRIAQLTSISDGLNLYSTKNDLPIPDDNVEVSASGTLVAYQWSAWANTLETIDFSKWWKDPKDDLHFSYYLTRDRKYFQLMAFLEETESLTSKFVDTTYAVDYEERIPTVSGKNLGILTDLAKNPIEQLGIDINFNGAGTEYISHIESGETITWNEVSILQWTYSYMLGSWNDSCKEILDNNNYTLWADWVYRINGHLMYCDMTTDWWGWTQISYWPEDNQGTYDTAKFLSLARSSSEVMFWYEDSAVSDQLYKHSDFTQATKATIPSPSTVSLNLWAGNCVAVTKTDIVGSTAATMYMQDASFWFSWPTTETYNYMGLTHDAACETFNTTAFANQNETEATSYEIIAWGAYNNDWYFWVYVR